MKELFDNPKLTEKRSVIEEQLFVLEQKLDSSGTSGLLQMVRHHFAWPPFTEGKRGKRIRPLLTLLCCEAAGGDWYEARHAAAAVETIHNFSLIHDDIQDQSRTRRGRPTLWTKWGTAQAINTGDSLFVLAHKLLLDSVILNEKPVIFLQVIRILEDACLELTIGQHLDLDFETRMDVTVEDYSRMIQGKTAALLAASCKIGAVIAEAGQDEANHYSRYGFHLGMAFQLLDDVLGIWGSPQKTGKPAGDDLLARKKTMPVLMGLQNSDSFRSL